MVPANYKLGPDDVIVIRAFEMEEISDKPVRVDGSGNINLPMLGRIYVTGMTAQELEAKLSEKAKKFVRNPEITVALQDFRSQPVSVLGQVSNPGVHQLRGRKTLVEILSLAGGLRPDAGGTIKITRMKEWGPVPLPNAKYDETNEFNVGEVPVDSIIDAKNPAYNITIQPHDVVSVPKGEMIYVLGEVRKSGAFMLQEKETLSVLEAISMAEGLAKTAAASHTKVLRSDPNSSARKEIPVNLAKVMAGKAPNFVLQPNDIVLVPNSMARSVAARAAETALTLTTGIIIWRR